MEAKTIESIKDEVAVKYGFEDFENFIANIRYSYQTISSSVYNKLIDEAAKLYAKQIALAFCEKQREICAESARMVRTQNLNGEKSFGKKLVSISDVTMVDKDSILNAPLAITID